MSEFREMLELVSNLRQQRKELERQIEQLPPAESRPLRLELEVLIEDILSASATAAMLKGKCEAPKQVSDVAGDSATFQQWRDSENGDNSDDIERLKAVMEKVSPRTKRQQEVLQLSRSGMTQKQIAEKLGVSRSNISRTLVRAKTGEQAQVQKYIQAKKRLNEGAKTPEDIMPVETLTSRQQEVLHLWRAGSDIQSIAKELGVTRSSVSRTLMRAKKAENGTMELIKEEWIESLTEGSYSLDLTCSEVLQLLSNALTPKQQVAMYLHFGERLSYSLCAIVLGLDKSTVIKRVHRGLLRLAARLPHGVIFLDNADMLPEKFYEAYQYIQNDFIIPESVSREKNENRSRHRCNAGMAQVGGEKTKIKRSGLEDEATFLIGFSDGSKIIEMVRQKRPELEAETCPSKREKSRLFETMVKIAAKLKVSVAQAIEAIIRRFKELDKK